MTSPYRFRHVSELDPSAVTVKIWHEGERVFGSIEGPVQVRGSAVHCEAFPRDRCQPVDSALHNAFNIANRYYTEIAVICETQDWRSEWGILVEPSRPR